MKPQVSTQETKSEQKPKTSGLTIRVRKLDKLETTMVREGGGEF